MAVLRRIRRCISLSPDGARGENRTRRQKPPATTRDARRDREQIDAIGAPVDLSAARDIQSTTRRRAQNEANRSAGGCYIRGESSRARPNRTRADIGRRLSRRYTIRREALGPDSLPNQHGEDARLEMYSETSGRSAKFTTSTRGRPETATKRWPLARRRYEKVMGSSHIPTGRNWVLRSQPGRIQLLAADIEGASPYIWLDVVSSLAVAVFQAEVH